MLGLAGEATVEGTIHLGDLDLTALDEDGWRRVRWRRISMAMQSAASLNPVLRVGLQLAEPQQVHLDRTRQAADARSAEVLDAVGLGEWALERYPRELSGGQRRLVLLALALVCDPEVLVLDEPTSGLDPATRNRVLEVLGRLRSQGGRALIVMSHDADALEMLADRVAVLYRGWLAEVGPAQPVLDRPRNPYSWALLNARPTLASVKDLRGIRGDPPNPTEVAAGLPVRRALHAGDRALRRRATSARPPHGRGRRAAGGLRPGRCGARPRRPQPAQVLCGQGWLRPQGTGQCRRRCQRRGPGGRGRGPRRRQRGGQVDPVVDARPAPRP